MDTNLHLLEASGKLNPFIREIKKIFPKTVHEVKKVLPINNVDIIVWDYPDWAIKQYGIGGQIMNANTIVISIDPSNPKTKDSFSLHFSSTLMHELHHTARIQAIGPVSTRLEASIREGLAEYFEIETTGKKPDVWDLSLTSGQLKKFSKIAKEDKSTDYYLYDWLFGNKKQGIPKWTGYSVGFYLVGEYLKKHPNIKSSTLYKENAEEFIIESS